MSDSRLEKFIYAICSMDVSDLPVPLSRIEKLWNCLITGETPDFEPLSRNEKYLMAMLDRYDISNLPAPMSRGEQLLYKIAVGETDLSDVPGYLSRYEELLKYLIENGEISGGDFEYVLHTLNQSLNTLYLTDEKPVKSAILKGQTLVNKMVNATYRGNQNDLHPNSNKEFINTSGLARNILPVATSVFEPNKTYTIILFLDEIEDGGLDMTHTFAGKNATLKIGANKTLYTTPSRLDDNNYSHNTQIQCNFKARYMVLDGDYTNVDIPYFTGMQSVKMPVLTTIGKNLFDESQASEQLSWGNNVKKANVKENTTYVYSSSPYTGYVSFKFYDNNDNEIGQGISIASGTSFTTPPNTSYLKTHTDNDSLVQIEEGTQATPYEPYKSNILTVNEPIELRGIGDVQDTLDCLTGEVVQNICEIVLDGNESYTYSIYNQSTTSATYRITMVNQYKANTKYLCNKLPSKTSTALIGSNSIYLSKTDNSKNIYIELLSNITGGISIELLKEYLKSNPIIINFEQFEKSVKTVDLTVVDQDNQPTQLGTFENITHVSLEAENLIPEVEMEVATNLLEDTVFNLTDASNTLYPTAAKPVKSAILKGQTLVNLFDGEKMSLNEPLHYTYSNGIIESTGDGQPWSSKTNMSSAIKPMTKYLLKVKNVGKYDLNVQIRTDLSTLLHSQAVSVGQEVIKIIETGEKIDGLYVKIYPKVLDNTLLAQAKVNIIEYQDGMENWDIPYFEGMQSVKMPVLTTSNKYGTKSNILTVNEPIELRGIGDVQDTLDCLTGEVVQNICEIVLDGSEDWKNQDDSKWNNDTHISFRFKLNNMAINRWNSNIINCISDKFTTKPLNNYSYILDEEFIGSDGAVNGDMNFNIKLLRSRLNGDESPDGFKEWLSQNPITVQYQLANESVKTVDLTVVNQDNQPTELGTFDDTTHVLLESEELIPTASLTVRTKIPSGSSTSLLMNDISTNQQQLKTTIDEQSENVDATMVATTEIFEETL